MNWERFDARGCAVVVPLKVWHETAGTGVYNPVTMEKIGNRKDGDFI